MIDYDSYRTETVKPEDVAAYLRIRRCRHAFPDQPDDSGSRRCRHDCGAALPADPGPEGRGR